MTVLFTSATDLLPTMSAAAAGTTKGAKSSNDQIASGVAALNAITSNCHAVLNTQLLPPSKKPEWFDDLNAKLSNAKVRANTWINEIAPELTASIPAHVINYANTYQALSSEIVGILTRFPKARGADDPNVQAVAELLGALRDEVQKIISEVEDSKNRLKDWGIGMQQAHDDLQTGSASIQKSETSLQTHINKMNEAIKGLHAQIDSENKQIIYAAGTIGVGLFAAVVGLALAPVTAGWSLVVCAGGLLAAGGGAAWWAVMQGKINSQFDEIAKDQEDIQDDQRQIIALQGLSTASHGAITSMAHASDVLSKVRTMWQLFADELDGTLDDLKATDWDLAAVVNRARIRAAQAEWAEVLQFARMLSGYQPPLTHRVLPMVG